MADNRSDAGSSSGSISRPRSPASPTSPTSPSSSHGHTNFSPRGHHHRPSQPSHLRHTHMPPESPEDPRSHLESVLDGVHPQDHEPNASSGGDERGTTAAGKVDNLFEEPDAHTGLLSHFQMSPQHEEYSDGRGTYFTRPSHRRGYGSFASSIAPTDAGSFDQNISMLQARHPTDINTEHVGSLYDEVSDAIHDGLLGQSKKSSTTHWLARRAGIKHENLTYIFYYIPITNWIRQYRWKFFRGDLIAAITMASFYIPMALSYASNLSHMPPINGMYAFVFNPFFYAILGTCPQMVVGPEAAGSLLTGSVVAEAIKAGHFSDNDGMQAGHVGGMVTGLAGGFILIAGLLRLGFLDSVLSRPFLRGFISSIGLVILINQLTPEMGLVKLAEDSERAHGSPLDNLIFLFEHGNKSHKLTCAVSFGAVAIILVLRELKRRLQPIPKLSWVVFIPDRFIIVVLSAVCAWQFRWHEKGVDIIGDIRPPEGVSLFEPHFPFDKNNFKHVSDAFETALILALLGFFESCVAAKSLGSGNCKVEKVQKKSKDGTVVEVEEADGIRGMTVSSNRELVALGVANVVGGFFMAIPAFGGYGRSKVNASTGGKTPMSSLLLSLITVLCVFFVLPYFYYIPKGVLSAMITVVSISLLEEAPGDIAFFWKLGGYIELFLMLLVFLTTFFWSLRSGIIVGIIFSLIRLLKHSTRPRIQILGRIPGTRDFENAELLAQEGNVEMIPNCLIVKIPEPLTFANSGSLKHRLKRLEDYGTNYAHPALPSVRSKEHNKNIIFDIHGVTGMDFAAAQVFYEIVRDYIDGGAAVFFCRLPSRRTRVYELFQKAGVVDLIGGESHFLRSVDEALRATETSNTFRSLAETELGGLAGGMVGQDDLHFGPDEVTPRQRRRSKRPSVVETADAAPGRSGEGT